MADAFLIEPGGKGLNMLLEATRLGIKVDGILAIGNDLMGDIAPMLLKEAGLSEIMLRRFPGATGGGVGFTDSSGENSLAVHMGANACLSAEDILPLSDRILRAGLVAAQFEVADAPIREAFRIARANGITTLLNPSPYRNCDPKILGDTSILVVNAVEARLLADDYGISLRDDEAGTIRYLPIAAHLWACGLELLIVTLGEEGAIGFPREEEPIFQPAFQVDAIDTLGAGDAFNAGLATALLRGQDIGAAMRTAAACGALTTRQHGVFNSLPTLQELTTFLDQKTSH